MRHVDIQLTIIQTDDVNFSRLLLLQESSSFLWTHKNTFLDPTYFVFVPYNSNFHPQALRIVGEYWFRLVALCHFLRSALAGRLNKRHANHTSNSGFDRTFMPCMRYFQFTAEQRVGNQITLTGSRILYVYLQHESKLEERTSDGCNGNHSASLPIILIKLKSIKCFHLHI